MQAKDYYQATIERRGLSPGGAARALLALVGLDFFEPDLKNNYVEISTNGQVKKKFAYSFDYLGAKAKLELINEDLEKLKKGTLLLLLHINTCCGSELTWSKDIMNDCKTRKRDPENGGRD